MDTDNGTLTDQVEEILILTRENNKLLKRIRRDAIIGGVLKIVIWLLVIVASFYVSAQFLEPYLGMLQKTPMPNAAQEGGMPSIGALYEQYKSLLGQ